MSTNHRRTNTRLPGNTLTSLSELPDQLQMRDTETPVDIAAAMRAKEINESFDFEGLEVIERLSTEGIVSLCELRHRKATVVKTPLIELFQCSIKS
jgi:hypothetical protein